MQMSTRSKKLHLTAFPEMNAFSERVPFSCPETIFESNTCHYINES